MRLFFERIGFQLVAGLSGLIISVITARWLGPEGKGALSLALLIPYFAASLSSFGLNDATAYLTHRKNVPLTDFTRAIPWHSLLIGLPVGLAVMVFFATDGASIWEYNFGSVLGILAGTVYISRLVAMMFRGALRAIERFNVVMISDGLEVVIPLFLLILIKQLAEITPTTALGAYALGTFAAVALCSKSIPSSVTQRLPLQQWRNHMASIWSYGLTTQLRLTGIMVIQRANFIVVSLFLGIEDLGLFAVAVAASEALIRIPDAASWIVTPRTARTDERGSHEITMTYARWVIAMVAGSATIVGVFAEPVILFLFDKEYLGATPALTTLLAGTVGLSLGRVFEATLVGRGQAMVVAVATWIGGLAMIGLDTILIPRLGLTGAAAASSIAYCLTAVIVIVEYFRRRSSYAS